MYKRKKLIIASTFGAMVLLVLVYVFFSVLIQSVSILSNLVDSPKLSSNDNEIPKSMYAKKQLNPNLSQSESQSRSGENASLLKNHTVASDFPSPKKNNHWVDQQEDLFESGQILESDDHNPDPLENNYDLGANKEVLLYQLEEFLANRHYSEQLISILNQLAWIGDSDTLAALIDGYQKTKYDEDLSSEILNAISKVKNPEAVHDLGDYMNSAIEDSDDTLLVSVTTALSQIGSEEATDMLIHTLSTTQEGDSTNLIVSKSVANIHNTDVAPILVNMIEKKMNGYEGAMEALLKLGDFGTEKITTLLTQDENIEYREKLLAVTETMQFDEETYYALNKLAELNEDFEDFFRDAGNNLAKSDSNVEEQIKE